MAIINRFLMARLEEVVFDLAPGQIQDSEYSSFTLDDPTKTPNYGTSDFFGLVKKIVLLGDVRKSVIDTNPKKLQVDPLPYNSYIKLTQKQFDDAILNGDIVINPNTNGMDEIIGWVELISSRPSLYYNDCNINGVPGKVPSVDNYFDLTNIKLGTKIVKGPTAGKNALDVIKDWNFNETLNNWGEDATLKNGKISPALTFQNYMYNAASRKDVNHAGAFFTNKELRNISLGLANREDHFTENIKTRLQTVNPITGQYESSKTVYTNPRDGSAWNITIGVRVFSFPTIIGNCLPLNLTVVQGGVNETDLEKVVPDDGNGLTQENGYDPSENISEKIENTQLEKQENYDSESPNIEIPNDSYSNFLKSCTRSSQLPFKYYKFDRLLRMDSGSHSFGGDLFGTSNTTGIKNFELIDLTKKNINVYPLQMVTTQFSKDSGISDPRNISGNDLIQPNGTLKALLNIEECAIEVHQNYRDKDGDIPEHVGPYLDKYMEDLRVDMMETFFTGAPLLPLGHGSDGLDYYSDGNSYVELHGQSIFGCGTSFSIADIPEIFNEMYRHKIDKFGEHERFDVKYYRKIFEKARYVPNSALRMNRWLESYYSTRDSATLRELIDDFTLGIPDLDFAMVSRGGNVLEHLYDIHAAQTGYDYLRQINLTAVPPGEFRSPFIDYKNLRPFGTARGFISPASYVTATDSNLNISEVIYSESGGGGQILGAINYGPGGINDFWSTFKFRDSALKAANAVSKLITLSGNIIASNGSGQLSTEKFNERILRQEAEAYTKLWEPNSEKPRPDQIYFFRVFDRFWARPMYKNIYIDVQFDDISIEEGKKMLGTNFPNDVDFEKLEIYDWPVFQNKTLKEMRVSQNKLSCASRWKAMMRPIYAELWSDPDSILPSSVATRKYFGEGLLELELGDYETHRKLFGMEKNLYDILDDTLSIKINENTFVDSDGSIQDLSSDVINETTTAQIQNVEYFRNLVNGLNESVSSFFNQKFADIVGFDFNRYKFNIDVLLKSSKNLDDYGSYVEVIKNTLIVYQDISETFKKMFPDVQNFDDFWSKIKKYYEDVSDFIDNLFTGGEIINSIKEDLLKSISSGLDELFNDFAEFADNAVVKIAEDTIKAMTSSVLESVKKQINRANPERSSLFPRRIFKNGAVYLKSKTGFYTTNRQPCPIIFLGFNDEVVLSSFSRYNGQQKCLSRLKKNNAITNIKYINPKYDPFRVDTVPVISFISPNIGNLTPIPNTDPANSLKNIKTRIDTIPVINKRPRQYGRNPFLDIFYLNLIPEAYANNPKSSEYTHRTGTPIPIRYPNTNDSNGRLFVKDYSTPSYFPPHWNETQVAEGSSFNYREQADLTLGDELYLKRQRLNILSAKERWNMSISPIGGGQHVVLLEDKTPILDIYFGLLQLHVHGIPWSELNEYINIAKSCLNVGTAKDTKFPTDVAAHFNSSINLKKLEELWEVLDSRLSFFMPLYISNGFWRAVEPITPFINTTDANNPGDFEQISVHVEMLNDDIKNKGRNWASLKQNDTLTVKDITVDHNSNLIISEKELGYYNKYVKTIKFMNNTEDTIIIKNVRLKEIQNSELDMFGNSGINMFSFDDGEIIKLEKVKGETGRYVLKPNHLIERSWALLPFNPTENNNSYVDVVFVPYGAQPGFKYTVKLEFVAEINNVEEIFSQILTGEAYLPSDVRNWNNELLEVSNVSFSTPRNIYDISSATGININFKNYSREDILLENIEIVKEVILDETGKEITDSSLIAPLDLFSFEESVSGANTDGKKILTVNETIPNPLSNLFTNELPDNFVGPKIFINNFSIIAKDLYKPNRIFKAECLVTYSLDARLNNIDRVRKTKSFEVYLYS